MLYFIPILSTLLGYRKCPKCGQWQQFRNKKKGDIVICNKCNHEFLLK